MAGTICWHELITSDVEAAASFYTELLGAELETADMGDFEYAMLKKGDRTHAGFVAKPEEAAEAPSHWYPYVQVDDVDAAARDGEGARRDGLPRPDGRRREPALRRARRPAARELRPDVVGPGAADRPLRVGRAPRGGRRAAAKSFYGEVAGWTTEPFMEGYEVFKAGETTVGGLMQERGDSPVAYWLAVLRGRRHRRRRREGDGARRGRDAAAGDDGGRRPLRGPHRPDRRRVRAPPEREPELAEPRATSAMRSKRAPASRQWPISSSSIAIRCPRPITCGCMQR